MAPVPSSPLAPLLRAGGGRHLHAAGRRLGAAAPSGSPGDAALLLAVGRVLRRDGVLVHRQARSRSTGCSTGATSPRSCCCRRSSCTSRWCSPIGRTRGCAATPGARCCRAIYLPALLLGAASVAGVINGATHGEVLDARRRARAVRAAALPRRQPDRRARDHGARAAAWCAR